MLLLSYLNVRSCLGGFQLIVGRELISKNNELVDLESYSSQPENRCGQNGGQHGE